MLYKNLYFSVAMPSSNAKYWPPCEEARYEKGKRFDCKHPDGMGHKSACIFETST